MTEKEMIQSLLNQGEVLQLEEYCRSVKKKSVNKKEITILLILIQIYIKEVENNFLITVFDFSLEYEVLVKHFVKVKVLLRRLDFGMRMEEQKEFYLYCMETGVSDYFIMYLLRQNMLYPRATCIRVAELFQSIEGSNSERGMFFHALSEYMEVQKQ